MAVSGCSSVYDIRAKIIDGRLAFVAKTDFFGNPDCVRGISVATDDGPAASPEAGDDVSAVRRGVYWEQTFSSPSCDNPFPVVYGARLSGPLFKYADGQTKSVKAKPLVKGITYSVSAQSSGSAYGGGKFRITPEGKVINLGR
ncbi:hypothetical protein [Novosphingobium sp. Leaf2]|uniref:hypothetical protein n=1 Tax=Novosphingobium sp. Leaf2 TaxID=1735670 RepID=UPI001F192DEF|nr:hypothetical protein [Novosphingobium sp. Leaf2]